MSSCRQDLQSDVQVDNDASFSFGPASYPEEALNRQSELSIGNAEPDRQEGTQHISASEPGGCFIQPEGKCSPRTNAPELPSDASPPANALEHADVLRPDKCILSGQGDMSQSTDVACKVAAKSSAGDVAATTRQKSSTSDHQQNALGVGLGSGEVTGDNSVPQLTVQSSSIQIQPSCHQQEAKASNHDRTFPDSVESKTIMLPSNLDCKPEEACQEAIPASLPAESNATGSDFKKDNSKSPNQPADSCKRLQKSTAAANVDIELNTAINPDSILVAHGPPDLLLQEDRARSSKQALEAAASESHPSAAQPSGASMPMSCNSSQFVSASRTRNAAEGLDNHSHKAVVMHTTPRVWSPEHCNPCGDRALRDCTHQPAKVSKDVRSKSSIVCSHHMPLAGAISSDHLCHPEPTSPPALHRTSLDAASDTTADIAPSADDRSEDRTHMSKLLLRLPLEYLSKMIAAFSWAPGGLPTREGRLVIREEPRQAEDGSPPTHESHSESPVSMQPDSSLMLHKEPSTVQQTAHSPSPCKPSSPPMSEVAAGAHQSMSEQGHDSPTAWTMPACRTEHTLSLTSQHSQAAPNVLLSCPGSADTQPKVTSTLSDQQNVPSASTAAVCESDEASQQLLPMQTPMQTSASSMPQRQTLSASAAILPPASPLQPCHTPAIPANPLPVSLGHPLESSAACGPTASISIDTETLKEHRPALPSICPRAAQSGQPLTLDHGLSPDRATSDIRPQAARNDQPLTFDNEPPPARAASDSKQQHSDDRCPPGPSSPKSWSHGPDAESMLLGTGHIKERISDTPTNSPSASEGSPPMIAQLHERTGTAVQVRSASPIKTEHISSPTHPSDPSCPTTDQPSDACLLLPCSLGHLPGQSVFFHSNPSSLQAWTKSTSSDADVMHHSENSIAEQIFHQTTQGRAGARSIQGSSGKALVTRQPSQAFPILMGEEATQKALNDQLSPPMHQPDASSCLSPPASPHPGRAFKRRRRCMYLKPADFPSPMDIDTPAPDLTCATAECHLESAPKAIGHPALSQSTYTDDENLLPTHAVTTGSAALQDCGGHINSTLKDVQLTRAEPASPSPLLPQAEQQLKPKFSSSKSTAPAEQASPATDVTINTGTKTDQPTPEFKEKELLQDSDVLMQMHRLHVAMQTNERIEGSQVPVTPQDHVLRHTQSMPHACSLAPSSGPAEYNPPESCEAMQQTIPAVADVLGMRAKADSTEISSSRLCAAGSAQKSKRLTGLQVLFKHHQVSSINAICVIAEHQLAQLALQARHSEA